MGWPSSHEHDREKRDDAAFLDHQMPPDLKAIHIAPVDPVTKRRKSKTSTGSEGAPRDLLKYVEQLERKVRKLESAVKDMKQAVAAEKAHVEQLKGRQNKHSNLLLQGRIRLLKAEHAAEIGRLKELLAAKEQELDETRKLAMKKLFP